MPPNRFESEVESFLEGSHGDRTHIKRADHPRLHHYAGRYSLEDRYAYGHVERYSFGGAEFSSASFEIFKKFAIMHFAADIRAAHQLPPLAIPPVTDVHPGFSIEFREPISYLLTSKASPIPKTYTNLSPAALLSLSYLMSTPSGDLLNLVLEPSGDGYVALFECLPASTPTGAKLQNNSNHVGIL